LFSNDNDLGFNKCNVCERHVCVCVWCFGSIMVKYGMTCFGFVWLLLTIMWMWLLCFRYCWMFWSNEG